MEGRGPFCLVINGKNLKSELSFVGLGVRELLLLFNLSGSPFPQL